MVRVKYLFGSHHTGHLENIRKQRTKYPDAAKQVIDISDIVLEVLDARFIEETRNKKAEDYVLKKGKKLLFILNKSDLVNKKEIEKNISKDLKPYIFVSAKTKRGATELREKIKIESKRVILENKRTRVQVGIIGYPNAGKSSLINLITRRGATKTSKQAGHTRGMQKVRITKDIQIIDTPGVISREEYSSNTKSLFSKHAKIGARTYSDVKDPEDVVHALMQEYGKQIEKFYEIDTNLNAETLIEELGNRKKYLKKGNQIDIDRTARIILKDWQEGKIRI